jgi:hypothetical protein
MDKGRTGDAKQFLGRARPKMRLGGRDCIFCRCPENRFGRPTGGATRDALTRRHRSPTLAIALLFLSH